MVSVSLCTGESSSICSTPLDCYWTWQTTRGHLYTVLSSSWLRMACTLKSLSEVCSHGSLNRGSWGRLSRNRNINTRTNKLNISVSRRENKPADRGGVCHCFTHSHPAVGRWDRLNTGWANRDSPRLSHRPKMWEHSPAQRRILWDRR